jgi:hypothetical protein
MPTSTQLKELAKRGAEMRLRELLEEVRSIHQMFPDLKDGTGTHGASRKQPEEPVQEAATATPSTPKARKRGWTAAQRQQAAERMKAYWAKRKKQKRA